MNFEMKAMGNNRLAESLTDDMALANTMADLVSSKMDRRFTRLEEQIYDLQRQLLVGGKSKVATDVLLAPPDFWQGDMEFTTTSSASPRSNRNPLSPTHRTPETPKGADALDSFDAIKPSRDKAKLRFNIASESLLRSPEELSGQVADSTPNRSDSVQHGDSSVEVKRINPILRASVASRFLKFVDESSSLETRSERPKRIVNSCLFKAASLFVIFINTGVVCYTMHTMAQTMSPVAPEWAFRLEPFFLAYYICELGIKCIAFRTDFWKSEDRNWNILDVVLVVTGLMDAVLTGLNFTSALRLMRVFRVIRLLRAISGLHQLRLMMTSVLSSIQVLCWAIVLVLYFNLTSGLLILHLVTDWRIANPDHVDQDEFAGVITGFSGVFSTMMMLFQTCTGGFDWKEMYDFLWVVGSYAPIVYVLYIIFFQFAFVNVITGMFVDKAVKISNDDLDEVVRQNILDEERMIDILKEAFASLDIDGSGNLSRHEVQHVLRHGAVRFYFLSQGINVQDANVFFSTLMGLAENDFLDVHTFVQICLKVKGNASKLDLQDLKLQVSTMSAKIDQILDDERRVLSSV